MKQLTTAAAIVFCVGFAALADEPLSRDEMLAAARDIAASIVTVEYELQMDRGEDPPDMWSELRDERPACLPAFLISPTECVIYDCGLHERFIRSLRVRVGERKVDCRLKAALLDHPGIILEFDEPFDGTRPLAFDDHADEQLLIHCVYDVVGWSTIVSTFSPNYKIDDRGQTFRALGYQAPAQAVVAEDGAPVAILLKRNYRLDEQWKGNPADFAQLTAPQLQQRYQHIQQIGNAVLPRVRLNFRSPKTAESDRYATMRFNGDDDEGSATERNVEGLIVSPNRILVMANLQPKATAMLEKITVFLPDGNAPNAEFERSLKDYGAFTAILDEPAGTYAEFTSESYRDLLGKLLLGTEVRIHGEDRLLIINRRRIDSYGAGWQKRMYLDYANGAGNDYIFNLSGKLVALPIEKRERVTSSDYRYSYGSNHGLSLPAADMKEILENLDEHADPGNVPRSEEEENMLAWMGVELQALNRELARINNVSHLTNDGEIGALVSHVYPGSPAEEAGVELGDVLLRLHVEGLPRPLEVKLEDHFIWSHQPFPWDRLDEVPEQYYEEIPAPWPSVENVFVRALTDVGFGKGYTAEFFSNGEVEQKELEVVQGPPHYEAAPKYKSEETGLTVRDLTYEVRRYFQRKPEDPGVIVSNIEMGSRASVAGLKPYEIITHINEQPVHDVKKFEELVAGKTDLRFSVNRMQTGRIVKISLPEKTEE